MALLEQTTAVEVLDTRITLGEAGKGKDVLLLHGNPGSRKDFSELLKCEQAVPWHYVLVDRPGHNGSEAMFTENKDLWLDADVYASVIDKKCSGRSVVVGYSMGCFLAAKLAIKHPEKVSGLLLIAPYLQPDKPEKASSLPGMASGFILGTILGAVMPMMAQDKMIEHLNSVFSPSAVPAEYTEMWLPRYTRFENLLTMMTDKNLMIKTLEEVHKRLAEIKCPIEIIAGGQDKICSVDNQLKLLQTGCPQSAVSRIEDGGHAINITHAADCLKALNKLAECK